jgi:nucleotide-binding universal stress UspA family protein
VSGVRRVVAGVDGSLGSLQALRYAAEEARERDALLVTIIAWLPPDVPVEPRVVRGEPGPVLTVIPPSALMEETARGIQLWPLRHRALVPDLPGDWPGRP